VLLPPENDEALSLNRYNQQESGILALKSSSNFFPSFFAV
jgi:hypothetical protein